MLYVSFAILCLSALISCESVVTQNIRSTVIEEFMNKDVKELFKVWHFVYDKNYDYNTEEGIRRFKTFKANVKKIKEHNLKKLSYEKGVNHLTDMTFEEVKQKYNLKPINVNEYKNKMKKFSLDDYKDEQDSEVATPVQSRSKIDWRSKMRPVRHQDDCGSCWAFATTAVIEGNYNIKHWFKLDDWLSTQQLIDCNTDNHECHGGWYEAAFAYYYTNGAILESKYPYESGSTNKRGICKHDPTMKNNLHIKIRGTMYRGIYNDVYTLLKIGPVGVAVDANESWSQYKSGIFDGDNDDDITAKCGEDVTHAVVLVGYGVHRNDRYWIVRNSWGDTWGEAGHIRMRENVSAEKNNSCHVEVYGYVPVFMNEK